MSSREGLRSNKPKSKSDDSHWDITMGDALKGTEDALDAMVDAILPRIREAIIQSVRLPAAVSGGVSAATCGRTLYHLI